MDFRGQFPWPELRRLLSGNYCTLPARFSDAVACYTTLIIVSPLSLHSYEGIKTYKGNSLESYLTHLRIYTDLDDLGTDYIRNPNTGRWHKQYLLPPYIEVEKNGK